jgi:ribonucleoside-diphosphate reductase alpha chain
MLQTVTESVTSTQVPSQKMTDSVISSVAPSAQLDQYKVIRRNGAVVSFEPSKIAVALTKAFIAVSGGQGAASARVREMVEQLTAAVVSAMLRRMPHGGTMHIEDIQELGLMRSGEHDVARAYVLYREERSRSRAKVKHLEPAQVIHVKHVDGSVLPLDMERLTTVVQSACVGLGDVVDVEAVIKLTLKDLYDGVPQHEVDKCLILSARSLIEKEPAYDFVTARLLLNSFCSEVLGEETIQSDMATHYADYFPKYIKQAVAAELLDVRLAQYDLQRLGKELDAQRDLQFGYLGLQTLYDR